MHRHVRTLSLGATTMACIALGFVAGHSASAQTNTIVDPGFESGLSGWSCPSNASAVTGHAHTGTYALAGAASASDTAQCTQNVGVSPNTTYTLSAYVN